MSISSSPVRSRGGTRRLDPSKHEILGKLFEDHVKQADIGTTAATLDVAIPFIHAMKKSHHDFMVRCKLETSLSAEQRMLSEMLPMPKLKETNIASYLLKHKDMTSIMYQSVLKLKEFTQSQDALLYILSREKQELFICPNHIHSNSHRACFKIEAGGTLASYVALHQEYVVTKDVTKDSRFPLGLGYLGICNMAAMGVPVETTSGYLIGVIELAKRAGNGFYEKKDELAAVSLAKWMGASVGITTEIQFFVDKQQYFSYIKHIITYYTKAGEFPFENTLTHLMTFSEEFFRATSGRLYFVTKTEEDDKIKYQLDMFAKPNDSNLYIKFNTESLGVRNSVAQTVMREKKALNMYRCDVLNYEKWFDDDNISSIICQPIIGRHSKSIGAIEFCNKSDGIMFTSDDEKSLLYLAKYLAVLLKYYKLVLDKKRLKSKIGLYTEMLSNHLFPCESVLAKMKEKIEIPHDLFTFSFFPKDWSIEYLSKLSAIIINKVLGICHFPEVDINKLIITVAKGHDDQPPFTNFLHTFTVLHCAAVILLNHRSYFSKTQEESIMLTALLHGFGVSSLRLKYSKGYEFGAFHSHYTGVILKLFKFSEKARAFWINMLGKACAERNHRRFHYGLCKFILRKSFSWDSDIHRFYVMALIMRVCEDAMWYKEFQYTAYMSKNLFKQMQQEQADLQEKLNRHKGRKRSKKEINFITGPQFVDKQINDLMTKCLPNIEILAYLLPGVHPLLSLACKTVEQWKLISRANECWLWEIETSWPKTSKSQADLYFSTIDVFIKEKPTDQEESSDPVETNPL